MSNQEVALSVQQPWAWLLVHADEYPDPKRIENRTWWTKFRGRLLIHASKTFDKKGYEWVISHRPDLKDVMPAPKDFELGGIVGEVHVTDCVDYSDSFWYMGNIGFVMDHPKPLPFRRLLGALKIFKVTELPPPVASQGTATAAQ